MAEISIPQLVSFCNDDLRTIADRFEYLVARVPEIIATYNARDLGNLINASGSSNLITDGSMEDGRTRVTGGDVFNCVTLLSDFVAFISQGRKDVIAKWQVNGLRGGSLQ